MAQIKDPSGSRGIRRGSILAVFEPNHYPLTRARAYNDCAKDAVLLKTASNRVSRTPKWAHFGVLKMARLIHGSGTDFGVLTGI